MAQLQVTADTSQAVGEHDKLTASVDRTKDSFKKFENQLHATSSAGKSMSTGFIDSVSGGFNALNSVISTSFTWMERIASGVHVIFNSLLKELDKIQGFNAIMSVTTGSTGKAAESFVFLRQTADQLGIQFDALSSNYAKLVAAIPPGNEQLAIAQRTFLGVSMAARTLHASNQDTQLMFYAVTQIASKGVVSMEELRRQLGEKMPGALQIAARAFGTTTDELEKAIRKGIVNSERFLAGFSSELIRTFHDSAEIAAGSVSAAINRLTNVWIDFVKQVLDSGAGQAIINVFDALREKLSDPYIIGQFAAMVGLVGDKITSFIKSLTAEDLEKGFDQFSKAVNAIVVVLGAMIKALTWLIDNAPKVAPVIGGLYGAVKGAAIGTAILGPGTGTVAGGAFGFLAGAALGAEGAKAIQPTHEDELAKTLYTLRAKVAAMDEEAKRATVRDQYKKLLGTYSLDLTDVPRLNQPENLSSAVQNMISQTLAGDLYSSDAQRREALLEYQKYGSLLPPKTDLKSIFGPGKGDNKGEKSIEGTLLESMGYNRNFLTEWANLIELNKRGLLSLEDLDTAQKKLIDHQPIFVKQAKESKDAMETENKAIMAQFKHTDELWKVRETFVRDNQEYIDQLREEEMLSKATAKETYVSRGLQVFDSKADDFRAKLKELGQLETAEATIQSERIRRQKVLEQTYDSQISAVSGLNRAVLEFNDNLTNHAKLAYDTWNNLVRGLQDLWTQFITTGKINFQNFINAILAEMAKVTWNKYIANAAGNVVTSILGFTGLESGGLMTSAGLVQLQKYAYGGIANGPQVALYGEGRRPEAYVPLPDGRSIPVTVKGEQGGNTVFNINQTLHVGSNVSRAEVAQALMVSNAQLKADLMKSRTRNGAFS